MSELMLWWKGKLNEKNHLFIIFIIYEKHNWN